MSTKLALAAAVLLTLASMTQAALISGVSIQDVSSELTQSFSRPASNTVTAPGLNINGPGTYSTNPDTTANSGMWLNTGDGCCGGFSNTGAGNTDPTPYITWNLGGIYHVSNVEVWNYNEAGNYSLRGTNTADVYTSTDGVHYTFLEHVTLNQAPGSDTTAFGQTVAINTVAQYIELKNMTDFPGADNNFVGLSAVQFNGTPAPEPSSLLLCGIAAMCLIPLARNRRIRRRAIESTALLALLICVLFAAPSHAALIEWLPLNGTTAPWWAPAARPSTIPSM